MPFVQTKFALPTVTRPDGTLGAYVQYNSNPRGDRYIWPVERIAIYQAQQAAKMAALKKQRSFSLLKPAVQSSANLKAAWDSDTHTDSSGGITDSDGVRLTVPGPGGVQMPSQSAQIANAAQTILDAITKQQVVAAANSGKGPMPGNSGSQSIIPGVDNLAVYIGGGLAATGLLIALAKAGDHR